MDADVSTRDVYRALTKLKAELRTVSSLTSMRIFAEGGNVVVSNDRQIWNVDTGQGHFDFAVRELADNVADLANNHVAAAMETEELSSDEWYNLGLDLEEVDAGKAPECYRRALQLDPENADAHVNPGASLPLEGDSPAKGITAGDTSPATHQLPFNLGTVFDELEDRAGGRALRMASTCDAHSTWRASSGRGDQVSATHMQLYGGSGREDRRRS